MTKTARLGFHGWKKAPGLSDYARDLICKKNKFHEIYGTHYIAGIEKGASLDCQLKITSSD